MNAQRLSSAFFLVVIAVAAWYSITQLADDQPIPTPWHLYLRHNDARLILLWTAALPLIWGIVEFTRHRGAALSAAAVGIVVLGSATAAAPVEAEKFFTVFQEPLFWTATSVCLGAALLRRFFGTLLGSNLGLFLFAFALGCAVAAAAGWSGWIRQQLPPNYHDEYAYLFQAWTYASGRFSYPADSLSPAFDQVHILNDGVFASRYFPGTALWLVPFTISGLPIAAMWCAHALATGFFTLAAERIRSGAGWLTAILVGTAPGMIVFSDSILSTAPTMAAFGLFLWAWFGVIERPRVSTAVTAGLAIGFAFITRPLTAVGLGFPFALYSLLRCWKPQYSGTRIAVASMTLAFAAGAALLPVWNFATLGKFLETPYSHYTATRTPSHVYGFYNTERAEPLRSEATFIAYDDWAKPLDPTTAVRRLKARVTDLFREGMGGGVFSLMVLLIAMSTLPFRDDRTLILWLSAVGLALAYTPYWFVGVFGFGYLAEALPLLLILMTTCAASLGDGETSFWRTAFTVLILLRAVLNVGDVVPGNFAPLSDTQFARQEKKRIVEDESAAVRRERGPILVLVDADPKTAVHSTLVNNRPTLDGPVVHAWMKPDLVDDLMKRYRDRAVYILEYKGFAQPFALRRVRGPLEVRR